MANLPDFGYSLWDFATGFESCPPDPAQEPVECHDWKTHMGWLNSNHFLPQSRRHYEHLHALAVGRAAECKAVHDALPGPTERERFRDWLLACEKEALAIEGVAQHFLQDSWSSGHMWERWGGPDVAHWGSDRTLGLAVAMLSGLIHGAKGILDHDPLFEQLGPFDDRLSGPHEDVLYADAATGSRLHGAGDLFFDPLRLDAFAGDGIDLAPQRDALLACSVDGLREVYEASAKLHGAVGPPGAVLDRGVEQDACWGQRATNLALAAGCGVDYGEAPAQGPLVPGLLPIGVTSLVPIALLQVAAPDLPALDDATAESFSWDAAHACTLAIVKALFPPTSLATDLAEGGLPGIVNIQPNSFYESGGATDPGNLPSSYADPFLPWSPVEGDPSAPAKEALNLTFADAHAADRCHEQTAAGLDAFVDAATEAVADEEPPEVIEARCGQCVQRIAPHLRFGSAGGHDPDREAFCSYVNPGAPFLYTGDDPSTFAGADAGLASLLEAAYERCGCCAATGAAADFILTRLGMPTDNADVSFAEAINDAGVVVGSRGLRAFRWTPQPGQPSVGTFSELSFLSGDDHASASDVNAQGDAVGSSALSGSRQTAVVWHGGTPSVVGPTAQYSGAAAISDAGLVSGSTNGVGSWVVDGGVVTFVGGSVLAINQVGELAGIVFSGVRRPAYWPSTTALPVFLAGGVEGVASDLNNAGLVVGTVYPSPGHALPFYSQGGAGWAPLPTIPGGFHREDGEAFGVNDEGEIVGSLFTDTDIGPRAVLWVDGEAVDLNTRIPPEDAARFVLVEANEINERGQIVGWGLDLPFDLEAYDERAFLLTPRCVAE
jgi:uncharacterized membrane protein